MNNVLEALSKQQRPQMGQKQMMTQQKQMMTQQQPMMMMQPQQMGPHYQQQVGFRSNPAGMQWNNGNQQDLMDMSMAGSSGAVNYRFPQ